MVSHETPTPSPGVVSAMSGRHGSRARFLGCCPTTSHYGPIRRRPRCGAGNAGFLRLTAITDMILLFSFFSSFSLNGPGFPGLPNAARNPGNSERSQARENAESGGDQGFATSGVCQGIVNTGAGFPALEYMRTRMQYAACGAVFVPAADGARRASAPYSTTGWVFAGNFIGAHYRRTQRRHCVGGL